MPTRLLHDSLLTSPSLRICTPAAQDAFHRFILLADDFGCFEAEPRLLVGRGWAYRPDVSEQHIRAFMIEYAMAGMLRLWEADGRWFAFLTGWWNIQRHRTEYSEKNPKGSKRKTPAPPEAQGDLAGFSEGRPPVSRLPGKFPPGKPTAVSLDAASHLSGAVDQQRPTPGDFPGGKPALPGENPDTQSQSQSQSQPQPERRGGVRGIGELGEIWHRAKGTPFTGPVKSEADTLLDEGFPPEHLEGALREALRAEAAGEVRALPGAFRTLVHKTPRGGEFRWEIPGSKRDAAAPLNHARKYVPPPIPTAPKEGT